MLSRPSHSVTPKSSYFASHFCHSYLSPLDNLLMFFPHVENEPTFGVTVAWLAQCWHGTNTHHMFFSMVFNVLERTGHTQCEAGCQGGQIAFLKCLMCCLHLSVPFPSSCIFPFHSLLGGRPRFSFKSKNKQASTSERGCNISSGNFNPSELCVAGQICPVGGAIPFPCLLTTGP